MRQPPAAILLGGEHRAARHCDRLAGKLPAGHSGNLVGRDIGIEVEREPLGPATGNPAGDLAAAVDNVRLGLEVCEIEGAIFEARRTDIGIDARVALGVAPGRDDAGAVDADRGCPAERGVARGEIDRKADRIAALRAERYRSIKPAARQHEIARHAGIAEHQPAGHLGAIDIEPIDRDPRRAIGGDHQPEQPIERAEQRSARDIERETLARWRERDADILETCGRIGIGEHQHGARPVGGDVGIEGEGAILRLPSAARKRGAQAPAARHHLAIEPGIEPRARNRHIAQHQRLARADAERALEADLLTRDVDDRVIADPAQHARQIGAQAPRHGGAELGEELGIGGHFSRAFDLEPARGYRPGERVGTGRNVTAQGQRCIKPGEHHPRGIGGELLCFEIIGQRACHPALDQPRIGIGVAGRDPFGGERHRHLEHSAIELGQAFLHQPLGLDPARQQPPDCQAMLDRQIAEGSFEIGRQPRLLETPAIAQQIGIAQDRAGARAFDGIVGEIDHACTAQVERARNHRSAAFENAVGKREAGRHRNLRPDRARQQILAAKIRAHLPEHADCARIIADLQRRHHPVRRALGARLGEPPRQRRSAPALPRAIANNPCIIAVLQPGQPGQHAARRRAIIGFEIEAVAIGLGIEQQRDPVTRAQLRLGVHQCAAFADVDLGERIDPLGARSRHPFGDHQLLDGQPVDPDIEIGQQGRVGIAREQFGQPRQPPAPRGHLADIQPAPQPVQWPPVDRDFGDGQEYALGIAHPHIAH